MKTSARASTLTVTRLRLFLFAAAALHCLLIPSASAAAGNLDPTFGNGGKVTTSFIGEDLSYDMVLQNDGKIIVAGGAVDPNGSGSTFQIAVARYAANGSLDPTFGVGGKVITAIGSGDEEAREVVVQSDGRIVVAGYSATGSNRDFALVRYAIDGSLDPTFGIGGKVVTPIGSSNDYAYGVALQSDGKIVAVGTTFVGSYYDFGLARYNVDGSLDGTFGSGGKVTTSVGARDDFAGSVALQIDGKILVAGSAKNASGLSSFALVRYAADGSLDSSFGNGGKVVTPVGTFQDEGRDMTLLSDGKILVAGYAYTGAANTYEFALLRYLPNGTLDMSFGTGGKVTTNFSKFDDEGTSLALQNDGKIVVAGYATDSGGASDFALVRYAANGILDTTFGTDGRVTTDFGIYDTATSVVVQSNGRIVAAGLFRADPGTYYDFALAGYEGDPVPEPSICTLLGLATLAALSVSRQRRQHWLRLKVTHRGNDQ